MSYGVIPHPGSNAELISKIIFILSNIV